MCPVVDDRLTFKYIKDCVKHIFHSKSVNASEYKSSIVQTRIENICVSIVCTREIATIIHRNV